MRFFAVLALSSSVGCGSSFYSRPDVKVQVVPSGALILPMPKSVITDTELVLAGPSQARVQRRSDGIVQLDVSTGEIHLQSDDFGGVMKVYEPVRLCYDVDQAAKTATITGYGVRPGGSNHYQDRGNVTGCATFTSAPDAGVPAALAAAALLADTGGSEHFNFGAVTVTGSIDEPIASKSGVFASVSTTQGLWSAYPDVADKMESLTRTLVVRGTMNGAVPDQLAVSLSPDEQPFLSAVTSSGSDYFWHSRDDRVYRISNDSVVLSLQYLGVGGANLSRDPLVQGALGSTVGDLLEGTAWTGVFETTDGSTVRLSIRTQPAASADFKVAQPFTALSVLAPNARAVRVCFSEQLAPASLNASSFSFEPAIAVSEVSLSASKLCASLTTSVRDDRPYRVRVTGLQSVFGNALPPGGLTFSLNGKRNGLIDFLFELFDGFDREALVHIVPTSSGGAVGLVTGPSGRSLWRTSNGFAFALPLEVPPGKAARDIEDVQGHGLWVVSSKNDAGITRVSHYDDSATEAIDLSAQVNDLVSLGDGSALTVNEAQDDSRLFNGVATPLPAAFHLKKASGFIRGSADVLINTGTATERRQVSDGALVATYPVPNVKVVVDDYLCAFGLYRGIADGGVAQVSTLPCLDLIKTPGGQVVMTGGEVLPIQLYTVKGNSVTLVSFKVGSQADHPHVTRPRFTSSGVFFNAESAPGSTPFRSSLEFATTAQWQALTDGGLQ